MKEHKARVRVRYPETDRMGIAHHTHHLVWFEVGRTELLRDLGMSYASLEAGRLFMPVIEIGARYTKPIGYDEEIEVATRVEEVTGVRVRFAYRLLRGAGGELVATGYSLHAATDETGAPRRIPAAIRERLEALAVSGGEPE